MFYTVGHVPHLWKNNHVFIVVIYSINSCCARSSQTKMSAIVASTVLVAISNFFISFWFTFITHFFVAFIEMEGAPATPATTVPHAKSNKDYTDDAWNTIILGSETDEGSLKAKDYLRNRLDGNQFEEVVTSAIDVTHEYLMQKLLDCKEEQNNIITNQFIMYISY